MRFKIRPLKRTDKQWARRFIARHWGTDFVVSHGVVHYPHTLRGFVAETRPGRPVGMATYSIQGPECELVTLNSLNEGEGVGTALIESVALEASLSGCSRLWCITTNDNHPALGFYQRRGFRITAVHPGAVERARLLKPSIPLWGIDSTPLRDEIDLELKLCPIHIR